MSWLYSRPRKHFICQRGGEVWVEMFREAAITSSSFSSKIARRFSGTNSLRPGREEERRTASAVIPCDIKAERRGADSTVPFRKWSTSSLTWLASLYCASRFRYKILFSLVTGTWAPPVTSSTTWKQENTWRVTSSTPQTWTPNQNKPKQGASAQSTLSFLGHKEFSASSATGRSG